MDQSSDDEEGCSSRQDCSSPEDDERPLKKARYRWQIKGKHHLKEKELNKSQSESNEDVSMDVDTCTTSEMTQNDVPSVSQNTTNNALPDQATSSSIQPPSEENSLCESLGDLLPDLFPRVNKAMNRTTYLLRCWQTKQIARGMLDNTMNCMMERMGFAPMDLESDTPQREGTQVEDEAILIAIQRYGLQHATFNEDEVVPSYQPDESTTSTEENAHKAIVRPVSCDSSTTESQESPNLETSIVQCDVSCSEGSSSHVTTPRTTPQVPLLEIQQHNNMNQPSALSQIEHDSFLDAAVAVAIQKKGLSVLTGTADSR